MAKLPRDVSGREVVQALERFGFVFVRKSKKGISSLRKERRLSLCLTTEPLRQALCAKSSERQD